MVDDGGHASDDFPFPYREIALGLAVVIGSVLLRVERIEFVPAQGGDPVIAVLVQFLGKIDESPEVLSVANGLDLYRHENPVLVHDKYNLFFLNLVRFTKTRTLCLIISMT